MGSSMGSSISSCYCVAAITAAASSQPVVVVVVAAGAVVAAFAARAASERDVDLGLLLMLDALVLSVVAALAAVVHVC